MLRCKRYRELFRFLRYFYQLNFLVQLDHGFEVTGSNPTGSIFKNSKTQFLVSHNVRNLLFKANQTLYFRIFLRSWVGFEPRSSDFVKISGQLRKIPKTELISQQLSQNAKRPYWISLRAYEKITTIQRKLSWKANHKIVFSFLTYLLWASF